MKILLLGANGQLGRALQDALAPLGEVVVATRDARLSDGSRCLRADLADAASLASALNAAQADVVVNAAAWTAVDRAEDEPVRVDRINHRAVGEIGTWAASHAALVVHYSTDYVFDGLSTRPYREDDPTAPLGVYGRSKLAGEDALRTSGAAHLILRTSWVYAAQGHNFLHTMLRAARGRDELRVVSDQIGAPTPARWISASSATAIRLWRDAAAISRSHHEGTYNVVASGQCSWFEFASAIMLGAQARELIARTPTVIPITTNEFPTRARRPAYSVLDCTRFHRTFGMELPDWRVGLDAVLAEIAGLQTSLPPEVEG